LERPSGGRLPHVSGDETPVASSSSRAPGGGLAVAADDCSGQPEIRLGEHLMRRQSKHEGPIVDICCDDTVGK